MFIENYFGRVWKLVFFKNFLGSFIKPFRFLFVEYYPNDFYVDIDYTGMGTSGAIKMAYGDIEIWSDAVAEASFTISPDETICEGGSTILNVTGGTNYSWSPPTGLDDINSANPTANPAAITDAAEIIGFIILYLFN